MRVPSWRSIVTGVLARFSEAAENEILTYYLAHNPKVPTKGLTAFGTFYGQRSGATISFIVVAALADAANGSERRVCM